MKCQILFWGQNKENNINLLSAELANSVLSVNGINSFSLFFFFNFPIINLYRNNSIQFLIYMFTAKLTTLKAPQIFITVHTIQFCGIYQWSCNNTKRIINPSRGNHNYGGQH